MLTSAKRSPKGTVAVEAFQGRLQLRWRYENKRYALSMGFPDSKVNRTVAQQKASQIELDIVSGNFDSTLKKYRPRPRIQASQNNAVNLFKQFTDYKAKTVSKKTLEKYKATIGYLQRFFKDQPSPIFSSAEAEHFSQWLFEQELSPLQCKRRLEELQACWAWALKQDLTGAEKFPRALGWR